MSLASQVVRSHVARCVLYMLFALLIYAEQIAFAPSPQQRGVIDQLSLERPAYVWCAVAAAAPIVLAYRTSLLWSSWWRRAIVVLLSVRLYVALLNEYSLACTYKEEERHKLCDFVARVSEDMSRHNLTHYLTLGSLLPIARHQSDTHYMIPWEHDIDLCVDVAQRDKFFSWVEAQDIAPYTYFNSEKEVRFFDTWARWYTGHAGVIGIDYYWCNTSTFTAAPLVSVEGCYGHTFPAPGNYLSLLENAYGPNWRKPQFSNNWGVCAVLETFKWN
eukprot:PhM_4_TR15883/c1_g1_i3/m.16935